MIMDFDFFVFEGGLDEDQREGFDDGEAGGGDAADKAVELQRRPGGAELPHPQRLLLPAQRRRQLL